jgi:tetratricopeptide (TPR) repeat protein
MNVQDELRRARELEDSDRIDEAIEVYTKIIESCPDCAEAWQNRGTLYFTRHDRFSDALADLEQFITLRPDDPNALVDRASLYRYVYFESGEKSQQDFLLTLAIEDLTRAIELGEADAEWREDNLGDTHFTRGTCYLDLGDYERAVSDFRRCAEDDATSTVLECLARAHVGLRSYNEALQAINRAIAMSDDNAQSFALRAEIHRQLGDLTASESDLRRAEELGGG